MWIKLIPIPFNIISPSRGIAWVSGKIEVNPRIKFGILSMGRKFWQNIVNAMKNIMNIWLATGSVFDIADINKPVHTPTKPMMISDT